MQEELYRLLCLQRLDTAVDGLKHQYSTTDRGEAQKAAFETAKAQKDALHAEVRDLEREAKATDLELKSVTEKHASEEKRLYSGKITNPKELEAIQAEVEMLARQKEKLAEKIAALTDAAHKLKTQESAAAKVLSAASEAYKERKNSAKQTDATVIAQYRELMQQRDALAKEVSKPLLSHYELLRAGKNGLAIVPLEDGNACGGCKMGVSANLVRQVQSGRQISTCQNCARILCEDKVPVKAVKG